MPEKHIQVTNVDGVVTLRLDRPEKRNAVSQDMWLAITTRLRSAAADETVRAVVIEGRPGVFCAGADLASVKNADPALVAQYSAIAAESLAAIRSFPRPTLAAIDGLCIGGGCNLALACDIRFAGPQATFAIPAVRHGIVYDEWSVHRLVDLLGPGRAGHLLFSATRIDARRAADIGLVDVYSDDLAAETATYLPGRAEAGGRADHRRHQKDHSATTCTGKVIDMTAVPTSDGFSLYAESTGSGTPILFVHEYAADHRTWVKQVAGLSGEFRCVT
jgi:enoyl-CoA hydratase/carnithine racemase